MKKSKDIGIFEAVAVFFLIVAFCSISSSSNTWNWFWGKWNKSTILFTLIVIGAIGFGVYHNNTLPTESDAPVVTKNK